MGNIGMAVNELPGLSFGEDETGGPSIFWESPYTGRREKIASLWWPEHPEDATEAVEALYEVLGKLFAAAPQIYAALAMIADIAEGSTTANSLPNIAKIARQALPFSP